MRASDIKEFMFELRRVARSLLAGEHQAHSVSTDALVNTAFLRNTVSDGKWKDVKWESRQYFFADMVRAMRRSLIDRIRRNSAAKRPTLEFVDPGDLPTDFRGDLEHRPEILELLDEALDLLDRESSDLVNIIHLHYYVGLTTQEVASWLDVSKKTVDRALKRARILLAERMMALSRESANSLPSED